MKNLKTYALHFAVCFLLAFVAGCGGRVERLGETGPVGGSAGSSGSGGSVATGGNAGETGATGGQAGIGGEAGSTGKDAGTPDGGSTASLTITLATTPVSSTHVKKEQNVPAVGITFTTGDKAVTLSELTITGQADQGPASGATFGNGLGAQKALTKDVTLVCLYDGDVILGLCQAPDSANGKATITKLNLTISANSSKTLTVKTSLASTIQNPAGDKFALGILVGADVVAFDSQSNAVATQITPELGAQAGGVTPYVVQTALNSGTLSITDDKHPASTNVVAGQSNWTLIARYKATAAYESAKIDRVNVLSTSLSGNADTADYAAIAVASNGQVLSQDKFSSGAVTGTRDIDLSSNPITIPKDGSVQFELWAKFASVQAWSVNSAKNGVARSGHMTGLGINNDILTGEWDMNYQGRLNVRTMGDTSGERLYAKTGAQPGNSMVLRKSKPAVTMLPLPSNVIVPETDQDLLKFQVTGEYATSLVLNQIVVRYVKSSGVDLAWTFGLKRGSTELAIGSEAWIVVRKQSADQGELVLVMPNQFINIGSGNVYTLHGVLKSTAKGQNVTFSFARDPKSLLPYAVPPYTGDIPVQTDGTFHPYGTDYADCLLWSDLSSNIGSVANPMIGDWTTDLFVNYLGPQKTVLMN